LTRAIPSPPPSVLRVSCHPLDGLLPLAPCPPCFRPTASWGFSLRSLLLAEVESTFLPINCPACRYHRPCFDEPFGLSEARGLLIDSRVLPRANPSRTTRMFSPTDVLDAPLGFFPFRELRRPPPSAVSGERILFRAWSSARLLTGVFRHLRVFLGGSTCPARWARHPS
jgi:hypothetical protein